MEKLYPNGKGLLRHSLSVMVGLGLFVTQSVFGQMSGNSYTINKNAAASSTNFQSFTSAVQALRGVSRSDGGPNLGTGVSAAVTITVTDNSGPYTEQITVPAITGASSTNTITFMGNGETIQHNSGSTTPSVIKIDGGDYLRFNDLHVKPLHSTYATGFWLLNQADHNIIENCKIDITSSTYTGNAYSTGIAIVGSISSFTSYSTGGIKGRWNTIRNNEIFGSSSSNGMYSGIAINGSTSASNYDHGTVIEDNYIHNFYLYGIYSYYYFGNTTYRGNRIIRGTKSSLTTFYGIYSYYSPGNDFYENFISDGAPTSSNYTFTAYGIYDYYGTSSYASASEYINNIIKFTNGYYLFGIYSLQYYATGKKLNHNTVYLNRAGSSMYYGYGIYNSMYTYDVAEIKNNIIHISAGTLSSTTYNIYSYTYGTPAIDGNVLPVMSNQSYHQTGYCYSLNAGGGGAAMTLNDWRNLPASPDPNGTNMTPSYVDVASNDMTPTLIDIDGAGVQAGVNTDINGNSRSATAPDPGAIEFDIPINVTSITFPTSICQGASNQVQVDITNSSALNLSNFWLNYEIDGTLKSSEQYTGTINAGGSGSFTFNVPEISTSTGNFVLKAYVRGKAPVTQVNYTVHPAPVGSYVSKGSVFVGAFNGGDAQDPDIVAYGDNIRYSIEPPAGYTSSQYGTQWDFNLWEMVTPNGTSAGAQHTKTNPTGGNNAISSLTPVISQSDSTFILRYAIRSISNGCVAPVVERRVFVAPRPTSVFAATAVCDGDAMPFDNNSSLSSGSLTYVWRFGDGDSTVLINPDHVYPGPGTYNVELVAISNYGYSHTSSQTVTVYENPTAEFSHTNVCEGAPTPFADGSIIPAGTPDFTWDFGDGSAMGTGNSPTHQYATPGVYTVTMTVTANGCSDQTKEYVTYAPRAVIDFSPSVVMCNNEGVEFTNNSTISSGQVGYLWEFGENNATSTQKHAKYDYSGYGSFDITLTGTTNFGCVDHITKSINLTEAPVVSFTHTSFCDVDQVDFTNTSVEPAGATTSYEWSFGDGTVYSTKDVSKIFPGVGPQTVTLHAFASNGCNDEFTQAFSIDESPKAEFYVEDVCEGEDVLVQNATVGNGGNLSYSWNLGAAGTSNLPSPTAVLPVGTHDLELTVTTPAGCTDVVTKQVTVNETPEITNIEATSSQKGDGSMTLVVSATDGASYVVFWGDGARNMGTVNGGTFTEEYAYHFDGVYNISVRLDIEGCDVEGSEKINVYRVGLISTNNDGLNVYPNPSNGVFYLETNGMDTKSVSVYSSNGQLVYTVPESALSGKTMLDLGQMAGGVYLVAVQTTEGIFHTRITLNK